MDTSFDITGAGKWRGGDPENDGNQENDGFNVQSQDSSTNSFDRVPLPVQVKDVVHSQDTDEKIHFGNYAFGTVRVCGRVVSKESNQDGLTSLTICDPDATKVDEVIGVNVYQSHQVASVNENDVILVIGKVRVFGDTKSIVSFGIVPVEDMKQAEIFKLEAELANRYYSKDIPTRIAQGECAEFAGTLLSNSVVPDVSGADGEGNQIKNEPSSYKADGSSNLTGLRGRIFDIIRANSDKDGSGVHISVIQQNMGSTKFEDDLQYLVNEGIVYNTVDDDHFATM